MGNLPHTYSKKPIVKASIKKFNPLQYNHDKLKRLLNQNKNPQITFYFEPHGVKASAKDERGRIKRIRRPSKVINISPLFLSNHRGSIKSEKQLYQDIKDMAHDMGATSFKF